MKQNTTSIILIVGGVAAVGAIVYFVFAPPKQTSSVVIQQGKAQTMPTSNNQITSAAISVGTSLIDKLFNINQPQQPTTDNNNG